LAAILIAFIHVMSTAATNNIRRTSIYFIFRYLSVIGGKRNIKQNLVNQKFVNALEIPVCIFSRKD